MDTVNNEPSETLKSLFEFLHGANDPFPNDKYILEGKTVVPAKSTAEWAAWFGTTDRRVARFKSRYLLVSTVFLGLDHNWNGGPPLIFEAMIFGSRKNAMDLGCKRYSTYEEAEKGHAELLKGIVCQINRFRKLRKPKYKRQL